MRPEEPAMTRRRAAITAVLLALVAAGGTPAQAQNVAQIARVRGGGACPGSVRAGQLH